MPTDKEKVKKALDSFEDDDYYNAEDEISKEIKKAKNDYFKKELDLENDIEEVEPEKGEEDRDDSGSEDE